MKSKLLLFGSLGFALLLGIVVFWGVSTKKRSDQNKRFCCDLVRVFLEINSSKPKDDQKYFESIYTFRQSIANSRLTMKDWEKDEDPLRKKALNILNAALSDLQNSADLALKTRWNEKEEAEFKVKLDDGLKKLYQTALLVMHPKTGLQLSESDKKELAAFTNRVFEKELNAFRDGMKQGGNFTVTWEIWAAAVMAGEFPKPEPSK